MSVACGGGGGGNGVVIVTLFMMVPVKVVMMPDLAHPLPPDAFFP